MPTNKHALGLPHRRRCLQFLGATILAFSLVSFHVAHFHLNNDATAMVKMKTSKTSFMSMQSQRNRRAKRATKNGDNQNNERAVFETVLQRAKRSQSKCNIINKKDRRELNLSAFNASSFPLLPEGGVVSTIEKWLLSSEKASSNRTVFTTQQSPLKHAACILPPSKSCHVKTYTVIFMARSSERFHKVLHASLFAKTSSWKGLTEIIFVWNSPRHVLEEIAANRTVDSTTAASYFGDQLLDQDADASYFAVQLLERDADPNDPLRIFYSIENGLTNNLMNRYHPLLAPKNEAIIYFDDDGPFTTLTYSYLIKVGLQLWKRNSNSQVGARPRHLSFSSEPIRRAIDKQRSRELNSAIDGPDNNFVPLCRNNAGDNIATYNRHGFPSFDSHILLPTGSIIHRNFMCFIWHPAFEEIRQYVLDHVTHPDDIFVSILIAQLSGRGPKTFPMKKFRGKKTGNQTVPLASLPATNNANNYTPNENHRRLMWEAPNWFNDREDAVNSILGYFGSLHPGSVGWCAWTPYMMQNELYPVNSSIAYLCEPAVEPPLSTIPWINDGGIGYSQCPQTH